MAALRESIAILAAKNGGGRGAATPLPKRPRPGKPQTPAPLSVVPYPSTPGATTSSVRPVTGRGGRSGERGTGAAATGHGRSASNGRPGRVVVQSSGYGQTPRRGASAPASTPRRGEASARAESSVALVISTPASGAFQGGRSVGQSSGYGRAQTSAVKTPGRNAGAVTPVSRNPTP